MLRRTFLGLALATPTVALVGLPTVTGAASRPRAIAPRLQQLPLRTRFVGGSAAAQPASRPGQQPLLSTPPTSTTPFALVGVTWALDDAVDVGVHVRTLLAGRWSPWQLLGTQADHRPDGAELARGTVRSGTAPLWVDRADGVQVRVDGDPGKAPRDVRIELIDPGTSPADRQPKAPRASAHADAGQPALITRAQWGADESIRRGTPDYTGPAQVGFVHHTASSNDYTPERAAAMVRGIYAYHVKSNGWSDIGYNFLVDRYGRAYEGRAGGVDKWVFGAHTGGFNSNSFAVSLLGDFTSLPPSEATLDTTAQILAWKLGLAYRDPTGTATLTSAGGGTSRYARGVKHTFDVVSGHRDAGNTTCPGEATYRLLPELRRRVVDKLGPAFVGPVFTGPAEAKPGERGPVTLSAGTLNDPDWTASVVDASGAVLRQASGTGGRADLIWDLTDTDGRPVKPGRYVLTLGGARDGNTARPVVEVVQVDEASCRRLPPLERARCLAEQRRPFTPAPATSTATTTSGG